MDTTVTNTVGQGRAPMRNATYIEEAVITNNPDNPITKERIVKKECLFSIATRIVKKGLRGKISKERIVLNFSHQYFLFYLGIECAIK